MKVKQLIQQKIQEGSTKIIVGTHALLSNSLQFKNLALVIIDEQHRFGVAQRSFLQQKTGEIKDGIAQKIPHLLTMTATPIPRTLSLSIFGNLDLSVIREFPKGRKPIKTKIVAKNAREEAYQFIEKEIRKGRQVFVICPLVDDSTENQALRSVKSEFKRLQKEVFPNLKLGLLHGKLKPAEKNKVMADFKEKKKQMLVSTSVVEVGVDVPNATIMMIEGAERFGLAQLHQFRGRVGRGKHQSYCFLLTSDDAPDSTKRLGVMEKTNDGLKIAQADLSLRGPGHFLGASQSGTPDITMEYLNNIEAITAARDQARRVVAFDPKLKKFPGLREQLVKLKDRAHWE